MTDHHPLVLINGHATDDEIAALVAVLVSVSRTPATPTRARPSEWPASNRRLRRPLHPGPGSWRASALPH
jgi:hypothetical protein